MAELADAYGSEPYGQPWGFNSPSPHQFIMKKNIMYFAIISLIAALGLTGCAGQSAYFRPDPSLTRGARSIDGTQYLPLAKICDFYGIEYKTDSIINTAKLTKGSGRIVLRSGSQTVLVNGAQKKMDHPAVSAGGDIFVPVSFVKNNFGVFSLAAVSPGRNESVKRYEEAAPTINERPKIYEIKTIVLDPGHGGKDLGATGRRLRLKEKHLALSVAKDIKSILESRGIRVILTRKDDTFISLQRRADIANRAKADLFVSVHINASRSRSLYGFECYHLSEATDDNARALEAFEDSTLRIGADADVEHSRQLDKTLWDLALTENRIESSELASYICDSVESSGASYTRGVRSAKFYVLKHTHIPAVLIEVGYLSNKAEEAKINDPKFMDKMAESLANGILKYKSEYERTGGFTRR